MATSQRAERQLVLAMPLTKHPAVGAKPRSTDTSALPGLATSTEGLERGQNDREPDSDTSSGEHVDMQKLPDEE